MYVPIIFALISFLITIYSILSSTFVLSYVEINQWPEEEFKNKYFIIISPWKKICSLRMFVSCLLAEKLTSDARAIKETYPLNTKKN